jgi:hypothetical protein
LLNWSLENHGLPPSAISDFNKDVFSTPEEWAREVRAGSEVFKERADRLEHLGDTADPVAVFDLTSDYELYRELSRPTAPFGHGDHQDINGCREELEQLRYIARIRAQLPP